MELRVRNSCIMLHNTFVMFAPCTMMGTVRHLSFQVDPEGLLVSSRINQCATRDLPPE